MDSQLLASFRECVGEVPVDFRHLRQSIIEVPDTRALRQKGLTFKLANGLHALAKVLWTFASWRISESRTGESTLSLRQSAKVREMHWREYSGLSPLANVSVGESLIGEIRCSHRICEQYPHSFILTIA